MAARLSQEPVEALLQGTGGNARLSQIAVEVLISLAPAAPSAAFTASENISITVITEVAAY